VGIYGRNFTLHTLDAQAMAGKLSTINYAFENVGSDGRCFEANLAGQGDAFADYQKTFDAASSVSGVGCWGLPYYGRGWTGVGPTGNGLFQSGTAAQGT
jgi:chitinase